MTRSIASQWSLLGLLVNLLSTSTAYAIGVLSRFTSKLSKDHWLASTATIGRVKNCYYNGKSKPIRRKHSIVRSYLSNDIITVDYIKSNDNLADQFTKALAKDRVCNTSRGMGLKSIESWAMYEDT